MTDSIETKTEEPEVLDQEVEDVGDGARLLALVLTLGLGGS